MVTYDSTPNTFIAGDQLVWTIDNEGYSLDQYKFGYGFLSEDGMISNIVNQSSVANGLPSFLISSPDSARWVPLTYYFQLYSFDMTNGDARQTVARGETIVIPDFSVAQAESQTMRTYKAICDLLEERASDDIASTSINGKMIQSMSNQALMDFRTYYAGLVKAEENLRRTQSGKKNRRTIRTRFNPDGGRGWWGSGTSQNSGM